MPTETVEANWRQSEPSLQGFLRSPARRRKTRTKPGCRKYRVRNAWRQDKHSVRLRLTGTLTHKQAHACAQTDTLAEVEGVLWIPDTHEWRLLARMTKTAAHVLNAVASKSPTLVGEAGNASLTTAPAAHLTIYHSKSIRAREALKPLGMKRFQTMDAAPGVSATTTWPTYITAAVTVQSATAWVADAASSVEASELNYGDELGTPG